MKTEVLLDQAHGIVGGELLRIVRMDPEALALLVELMSEEEERAAIPDWFHVARTFEPSSIQPPGRAPQGTLWSIVATPAPDWFVTRLNASEGGARA